MARESCNLDKDEAEILKPSSSSSPSPSPSPSPPPPPPSPPSVCVNPPPELPVPKTPGSFGNAAVADSGATLSCESHPSKEALPPVRLVSRCSSCRKRVGLTGFRCRCGDLFCASHRYSDTHDCSFDYKAAGREQIAKANPLIRAAKVIKI
ncbi:zinc finger AN1 domain-containing stress-associated protein 15-like [Musa acuminata AAA Group]|uniref:zinc finger AN1 domain-containing stress-associated protein 15-like n=1 Tax=Musa acuminata AAA Group TaxID=214697 RepID=UPI0031DC850A